jgi:hypothetical protein
MAEADCITMLLLEELSFVIVIGHLTFLLHEQRTGSSSYSVTVTVTVTTTYIYIYIYILLVLLQCSPGLLRQTSRRTDTTSTITGTTVTIVLKSSLASKW